jgi:hypothetical protein
MKPTAELLAQTTRLLPELDKLEAQLEQEPKQVLARAFPASDPGLRPRAIVIEGGAAPPEADELDAAVQKHRERLLMAGKRALAKIRAEGPNAQLDQDEADGLEAIVLPVARPALLIQGGSFARPLPPWEILTGARPSIEHAIRSVGRVQLSGHQMLSWAGTAWLVGKNVVMTNRHVAREFCERGRGATWAFRPGMGAGINYSEDPDRDQQADLPITEIIGVHDRFDLALFKVRPAPGPGAPEPLTIASQVPDPVPGRKVYVIGYPAYDPRNGEAAMRNIFANIYNVKRLQPGQIIEFFDEEGLFNHDSSTLGGNSGSAVIDLERGQVVGLHFSGSYLEYNQAVALWKLRDDPLLRRAKVNFD